MTKKTTDARTCDHCDPSVDRNDPFHPSRCAQHGKAAIESPAVVTGACDEHKAQNAAVSEVADAFSEADEVALATQDALQAAKLRVPRPQDAPQGVVDLPGGFTAYLNRQNAVPRWLVYHIANQTHVLMPDWWAPDSRFACKAGGVYHSRDTKRNAKAVQRSYARGGSPNLPVITADLATGEEVPCG